MLWLIAQRNSVDGGLFMQYFRTLPCRPLAIRGSNLFILILSDTPLWLPVLASTVVLIKAPETATQVPYVGILTLVILNLQLGMLERNFNASLLALLGNVVLVGAISNSPSSRLLPVVLSVSLATLTVFLPVSATPFIKSLVPGKLRQNAVKSPHRTFLNAFPSCQLSLRALFVHYRATTAVRLAVMLSLSIGAISLMQIWDFDYRALPLTLILDALIALIAAGAFRDLHREHNRAAPYFVSLPITYRKQAEADSLAVLATCLPFLLIVTSIVAMHRNGPAFLVCLGSVVLCIPLVTILRVPIIHTERHSLVLACLLVGVWLTLTWRAMV